jgi:DNA-binding NarL/FixJ family response regulator
LLSFIKSIPELELLNAPVGGLSSDTLEADQSKVVDLLIFDILSRDYDDWAELRGIKARLPRACCITLVISPQQMALAQAAGADQVLLRGFSTQEFLKRLPDLP